MRAEGRKFPPLGVCTPAPPGLVTGAISVKLALQYGSLRAGLGRSGRIVVARAVEVDALVSVRIQLGPIPRQSRFVHRRKLHMTVTRKVSDFGLDELVRCH